MSTSQSDVVSTDTDILTVVDRQKKFTVVSVRSVDFAGVGVSKRNLEDPYDPQTGYDLALARALRDAADHLEARARA